MEPDIKCRAWDRDVEKMFNVGELHLFKVGNPTIVAYVFVEGRLVYCDEIVEQKQHSSDYYALT